MPFLDNQRWYELGSAARMPTPGSPAIFLDRDGVIIEEKHYLRDPAQVELCPGAAQKIRALKQLGLPIVVVTNQSGIGQGLFGWPEYLQVHQRMLDLLETGDLFAAVYANGHTSAESDAAWRKPNPGMLLQAASDLRISLEHSVMVGDKLVDLQAGQRAGVRHLVQVKTGHGVAERPKVLREYPTAHLTDTLADVDFDLFFPSHSSAGADQT
jgi:D-glycero-D-manno-heptose 1,7-bisphosphate phosphatase